MVARRVEEGEEGAQGELILRASKVSDECLGSKVWWLFSILDRLRDV